MGEVEGVEIVAEEKMAVVVMVVAEGGEGKYVACDRERGAERERERGKEPAGVSWGYNGNFMILPSFD